MSNALYKKYLIVLLLLILAFNTVDRLALGLVLQDIKADLHLSDLQLGLLTGLAFALFYSIMGVPIAWWADRGNRARIIALTTAIWSVLVAMSGFARSFPQLIVIRVAVGVGEAGCMPTSNSLLAAEFDRDERPRAVSRYLIGGPLSLLFGYLIAGWLNQYYGWRTTFVVLSIPGAILAILAWCTLREPRRRANGSPRVTGGPQGQADPSAGSHASKHIWADFATLYRNKTYLNITIAYGVMSFFGFGVSQWLPSLLVRSYGLRTGEIGTSLGLIYSASGVIGMFLGGEFASRGILARNERLQLRAAALIHGGAVFLWAGAFISQNQYITLGLIGVVSLAGPLSTGPIFSLLQTLVPERLRAVSIAVMFLFSNLLGLGLGPLAVGALSDALGTRFGPDSLRYALLLCLPLTFWAAWHFWLASKTVGRDLESVAPDECQQRRWELRVEC